MGVRPNLDMLEGLGLNYNQGLETDEYMRSPLPDIYAAGDVVLGPVFPLAEKAVRAIWINAVEQGMIAGINMAGGNAVYRGSRALNSIQLFGLAIASAGTVSAAEGQREEILSYPASGNYCKLVMAGETLAGALLAGDISRAGPLFQKIGGPLSGYLGPGAAEDSAMLNCGGSICC
jgi:NAD(P)H-nitrite reductase large subunit